ncbi:alpha/beta fold hydrolase [Pseudomonas sp. dw_358]|uniref:alpha/beta fold hydrolase n=1 Tax=Pseudomonas sp. dw_358 TaxID=2720083 RepID=UPI001BD58744|nr:alpha/beta fold hydrolase [Pseudomonas sp. dw_358]
MPTDYRTAALGDLLLQSGQTLIDAQLAFHTQGQLNAAGDNAVLLPSYYTGNHRSYQGWIGPGRALDPERLFIISVNLFGNGYSSSPSNSSLQPGADFPRVSLEDNIQAQRRLLWEVLGVRRLALVAGWSMGAMQAFNWAARFPDDVAALLAVCGTARCWPLNQVFLQGVRAALQADSGYAGGRYETPPERGLRAFGRSYAGWAYSAQFFRERLYQGMGFASLEALLQDWEDDHLQHDANDLLTVLDSWHQADLPNTALAAIRARCLLMPGSTDAYFTQAEARLEYTHLQDARFEPLVSPYGHCAGAPGRFADETRQIDAALARLLG